MEPQDLVYYNNGKYLCLSTADTTFVTCPVYLPQGAMVTQFTTYFYAANNGITGSVYSQLYKGDLRAPNTNAIMAINNFITNPTSNLVKAYNDTTIDYATIDNQNNQYYIQF